MNNAELIARLHKTTQPTEMFPRVQRAMVIAAANALEKSDAARTALRLAVIRIASKEGANETELREMLSAALIADAHPSECETIRLEQRVLELSRALRDCLSTFRDNERTTVITGDRQEMWKHVLERHGLPEA